LTSIKIPISADMSGTGILECKGYLSGVIFSANGTNANTTILRDGSSTGQVLFHAVGINTVFFDLCVKCESGKIYYSISGTGATGMLYGQRMA